MSGSTNDKTKMPTRPARGGLRLVKANESRSDDIPAEARSGTETPRPKSRLAQFLTAYADAIDRDVKAIMDL